MSAISILFTDSSKTVQLGAEIGRGGEGTVYDVPGMPDLVAKLYHRPLPPDKQRKLRVMANARSDELRQYVAWPVNTLHERTDGAVIGFLMPKVIGYREIHRLYHPKQRRQEFPDADWHFLVRAARNTSAAVARLHRFGQVVGDLNPKNVVVSNEAMVKLVDCDSFQVNTGRELFSGQVGMPHFIAPELQRQDLTRFQRTPNHDNFALALIVFHLLFLGRHPFAGIYRNGQDDELERAMCEFRFAYGPGASTRGMRPPPLSLPWGMLPSRLQTMLETAFTAPGVRSGRPSAQEWVQALDQLESELVTCKLVPAHKHPRHLQGRCPWCGLEQQGFSAFLAQTGGAPSLDLDAVWSAILSVMGPGVATMPAFSLHPVSTQLPASLVTLDGSLNDTLYAQTLRQYQTALNKATQESAIARRNWTQVSSDSAFAAAQEELQQAREQLLKARAEYKAAAQRLAANTRSQALLAYLENHFIHSARIRGIGPERTSVLIAHGIETAADLT